MQKAQKSILKTWQPPIREPADIRLTYAIYQALSAKGWLVASRSHPGKLELVIAGYRLPVDVDQAPKEPTAERPLASFQPPAVEQPLASLQPPPVAGPLFTYRTRVPPPGPAPQLEYDPILASDDRPEYREAAPLASELTALGIRLAMVDDKPRYRLNYLDPVMAKCSREHRAETLQMARRMGYELAQWRL